MTRQSTIFGSRGVAGTQYLPGLRQAGYYINRPHTNEVIPGFDGDGDALSLPVLQGGDLIYYDNTGSLVWSYAPADVFAGADAWGCFFIDENNDFVCIVTRVVGFTSLNKINKAGAITNIGGEQVFAGAGATNTPNWSNGYTASNSSVMWPRPDGNYSIFMCLTALGVYENVINAVTGVPTIAADFAFPDPLLDTMDFYPRSDSLVIGSGIIANNVTLFTHDPTGAYLVENRAPFSNSSSPYLSMGRPPGGTSKMFLNLNLGLAFRIAPGSAAARIAGNCWTLLEYDNWLSDLSDAAGVTPT